MFKYWLLLNLFGLYTALYAELAGGRPNSFSGGNNAFAGVVNPANAVWLVDRFDFGVFWVNQKSTIDNRDNNPNYPLGKTDFTYKSRNIFTGDGAINKHVKMNIGGQQYDSTLGLAFYTVPAVVSLGTKEPIPISGTTPIRIRRKTQILSAIFSLKLNDAHSIGFTIDYLRYSLLRNGYQNIDNPQRSVSPGNVTNNGRDYSNGIGFSLGWRWNITKALTFGTAWVKKSYCGQYRKYRGFEPHFAQNYTPQTIGAGFSYRFAPRVQGRLEVLWSNLGNLPGSNNSVLPNGNVNTNKRGSKKSPGPGLSDATFINMGLGYQWSPAVSLGAGYSHRIKLKRHSPLIISHSYMIQAIYNTVSLGANFKYQKHDLFMVFSNGFKNKVTGELPSQIGGGKLVTHKQNTAFSISWGYRY